jgi:hypothetical protein
MDRQFQHHYTVAEARALLPEVRAWLNELRPLRLKAQRLDEYLSPRIESGEDLGGLRVGESVRMTLRLQELQNEFISREIQVKDLERGLVDFPSLRGDREVFLCWEEGDEDIEFWHDLESGFAGREPI